MGLHVILRSASGENRKRRPAAYDKFVALVSLVRSVREAGTPIEVIFLNDGHLERDRLGVMRDVGEVIQLPDIDASRDSSRTRLVRSYRAAVDLGLDRGWPESDLVYLGEDDYLFRPEAFRRLVEAAESVQLAEYFVYTGSILEHETDFRDVDGCLWHIAHSTTSSFAARIRALRADRSVHHLGLVAANDTHICLTLNGVKPFPWSCVIGDFLHNAPGSQLPLKRRLALAARRSRMNLMALRRSFRRHPLAVPYEPLAMHWELPYRGHAAGLVDWDAVAEQTRAWAATELRIDVASASVDG